MTSARVVAVHADLAHAFSKIPKPHITLLEGLGVEGDAHCGATVQHRSRLAQNPLPPNLRQVHLIQAELFDELATQGFSVAPGDLGEYITTRGIDLLRLPQHTVLLVGDVAQLTLTGLRNPCAQIERFQKGLLAAVLDKAPEGALTRKAGVMAVVTRGGRVQAGDRIHVTLPREPHSALDRV